MWNLKKILKWIWCCRLRLPLYASMDQQAEVGQAACITQTLTDKSVLLSMTQEWKKAHPNIASTINVKFCDFSEDNSNTWWLALVIPSLKHRLDREVEVEDFQQYPEKVQTSLYGCPVESPPVALLHKKGKNSSKAKGNRNKKVCYKLPQYHPQVFQSWHILCHDWEFSKLWIQNAPHEDYFRYMKERILLLHIFHHCKWLPWPHLPGLHLHNSLARTVKQILWHL